MEVSGSWCGVGVIIVILVWYASKVLNWVWLKPRRIEKSLREQGLKGSSYKFLYGDLKEMVKVITDAKSKPIKLTDDIVPRILPFDERSINTYGKTCFTWLGPRPLVHITEPALIKEILANNYRFQKMRIGSPFLTLLANGLPSTETGQWSRHRKIINPAFRIEKLKHMISPIYTCCAELINKWEDILNTESSVEVDVWPYLQTLTADVISRTAFGSSFEEGRKIFDLQREQTGLVAQVTKSIYIPGTTFLPTKRNKRIKEIAREVKATIQTIIDKRIIAMKNGESCNDDLLSILLDSNYKEIEQQGDTKFGLSIDEVIEECKVFYFAGQETTGSLLVWTMILLSQHTNWQNRARDEVLQVFGKNKPDIEGLNRLRVINMIFNEVLRLYPPAVTLGRRIHKETKLGEMTLPAGTFLQMQAMLLHHDKDIWGDDVKEFRPERFSEGVSKVTKGQTSYLPFGAGPRVCIGQNFSLMEAKMALAVILQRFQFDLSPSYSHAPYTTIILQPQFGAHLILRKLK